MQKIDYADAPIEALKVSRPLGSAGFAFLSEIVKAKESGQKLPKFLDKIATLTLSGKNAAVTMAKTEAKKEVTLRMGWIVAGVVIVVLIFVIAKK